jgi:hypothetical protein
MTLNAPLPSTRAPNGSFSFDHGGQASRSAPARAFPTDAGQEYTKFLTIRPKAATVATKRSRWGISASRPRTQWCAVARPCGTPEPLHHFGWVPDAAAKNEAISGDWRRNHPWNPQNPRIMMMAGKFAPFALPARNVHKRKLPIGAWHPTFPPSAPIGPAYHESIRGKAGRVGRCDVAWALRWALIPGHRVRAGLHHRRCERRRTRTNGQRHSGSPQTVFLVSILVNSVPSWSANAI